MDPQVQDDMDHCESGKAGDRATKKVGLRILNIALLPWKRNRR